MSTPWALALAFGPTALAFMLLGIGNAKRRRTAGEPPAPPLARRIGTSLIIASGLFVLVTAGAVAFLIWISALGAVGWALANGVVLAASWSREGGPGALPWAFGNGGREDGDARRGNTKRLISNLSIGSPAVWLRESLCALGANPVGVLALASAVSAVLCLGSALVALWTAEKASFGTKNLLAVQTVATLVQDRSTAVASPCLVAFERVDAAQALRDLLSGRPFSVTASAGAAGVVGSSLQRCIAAAGGDEIAVETDKSSKSVTYSVSGSDADVIRELIASRLRHAELLAAVYAADPALCRIVRPQIDADVVAFTTLLQRERDYAKAQAMLDGLPSLGRLVEAQPAGSTCP